jgi:hypothetical protein
VKDNTTQKLLFAVLVFAAVSMAVWAGVRTAVEAPARASAPAASFAIPF